LNYNSNEFVKVVLDVIDQVLRIKPPIRISRVFSINCAYSE